MEEKNSEKLLRIYNFYKKVEDNLGYLESDNRDSQRAGAEYFSGEKFHKVMAQIPLNIFEIFPLTEEDRTTFPTGSQFMWAKKQKAKALEVLAKLKETK